MAENKKEHDVSDIYNPGSRYVVCHRYLDGHVIKRYCDWFEHIVSGLPRDHVIRWGYPACHVNDKDIWQNYGNLDFHVTDDMFIDDEDREECKEHAKQWAEGQFLSIITFEEFHANCDFGRFAELEAFPYDELKNALTLVEFYDILEQWNMMYYYAKIKRDV